MTTNTTPTGSASSGNSNDAGGVKPIAFNNQVFLLDYFAANPSRPCFATPQESSDQVRQLSIDNANAMLPDYAMDHLDGFIQNLLPADYAQLHPVVKLFLVTPDDKQILVPLTTGTDIDSSVYTNGFYSGKTAGLKSLSMRVDGNTDQISGKIYNIEMKFIFDSLNTFFNPVSQETTLTWASILRSYDINSAGGTRLKLCIGYETATGELNEKYGLTNNFYVCYLQFIDSVLTVEENLKTSIKVKFQSFEEGLLAQREIFDFLKLKQSAGIANLKQQLKDHAERSEKEYATVKRKKIQEVEKLLATTQANVEAIKRGDIKPKLTQHARMASSEKEMRNRAFQAAISNAKKKEADLQTKLQDIQKAKPADFAPAKFKENEEKRKELELKEKNFRRDHINNTLYKMLFGKTVFTTLPMTSEQVASYLNLLEADAPSRKDYLNPNSTTSRKGPTPVTQAKPAKSHKGTSPEALKADVEVINKEVKRLNKPSKNSGAVKSIRDGGGDPYTNSNAERWRRAAKAKAEEKRKQTLLAQTKITSTLGGMDAIGESLKNYKHIEFVTLGDLLSCVMNYLKTVNSGPQLELVKRELILLTQLELSDTNNGGRSITQNMYNIPIATDQLRLFFQNQLFGKSVQVMTVFDLFKGVIRIIKNAQARRSRLTKSMTISRNNYAITFTPHAVEIVGGRAQISTKVNNSEGVFSGVVFSTLNSDPTFPQLAGLAGNRAANIANKIPHFILGGAPQGAVKNIKLSEKTAKGLQEAAYEANMGSKKGSDSATSSFLPAIFKVDVTLCGTPFFCMTGYFYLGAPSLSLDEGDGNWLDLPGYYKIIGIEHSYMAGGQYETTIEGLLEASQRGLDAQAPAIKVFNGSAPSTVKPDAGSLLSGKKKGRK